MRTSLHASALAAAGFAAAVAFAQNPLDRSRPAPQGAAPTQSARGNEGFFRPTDLPLNPPPATASTPVAGQAQKAPEVVVNVVPEAFEAERRRVEEATRAQLEAERQRAARRPEPIVGAFTGETRPETR